MQREAASVGGLVFGLVHEAGIFRCVAVAQKTWPESRQAAQIIFPAGITG
jgi:hypothetical protein